LLQKSVLKREGVFSALSLFLEQTKLPVIMNVSSGAMGYQPQNKNLQKYHNPPLLDRTGGFHYHVPNI